MSEVRACPKCEQFRPLGEFYKGHKVCRICAIKRSADWTRANRARHAEMSLRSGRKRLAIKRGYCPPDEPSRPIPSACECCGRAAKLALDHCHSTGKFRGWLCQACNTGIGKLGDTMDGLRTAMKYLESCARNTVDGLPPQA